MVKNGNISSSMRQRRWFDRIVCVSVVSMLVIGMVETSVAQETDCAPVIINTTQCYFDDRQHCKMDVTKQSPNHPDCVATASETKPVDCDKGEGECKRVCNETYLLDRAESRMCNAECQGQGTKEWKPRKTVDRVKFYEYCPPVVEPCENTTPCICLMQDYRTQCYYDGHGGCKQNATKQLFDNSVSDHVKTKCEEKLNRTTTIHDCGSFYACQQFCNAHPDQEYSEKCPVLRCEEKYQRQQRPTENARKDLLYKFCDWSVAFCKNETKCECRTTWKQNICFFENTIDKGVERSDCRGNNTEVRMDDLNVGETRECNAKSDWRHATDHPCDTRGDDACHKFCNDTDQRDDSCIGPCTTQGGPQLHGKLKQWPKVMENTSHPLFDYYKFCPIKSVECPTNPCSWAPATTLVVPTHPPKTLAPPTTRSRQTPPTSTPIEGTSNAAKDASTDDPNELQTWQIALMAVGAVAVLAVGAIIVVVILVTVKKRKLRKKHVHGGPPLAPPKHRGGGGHGGGGRGGPPGVPPSHGTDRDRHAGGGGRGGRDDGKPRSRSPPGRKGGTGGSKTERGGGSDPRTERGGPSGAASNMATDRPRTGGGPTTTGRSGPSGGGRDGGRDGGRRK